MSINIDVPNLDAETEDDLRQFGKDLTLLATYATCKANAMFNRKSSLIEMARLDEEYCERLYETLPPKWRW